MTTTTLAPHEVAAKLDEWDRGYLTGARLRSFYIILACPATVPDAILADLSLEHRHNARAILEAAADLGYGTRTMPPMLITQVMA